MIAQQFALHHSMRLERLVLGCTTDKVFSSGVIKPGSFGKMIVAGLLGPRRGMPLIATRLLDPKTVKEQPEIVQRWVEIEEEERNPTVAKLGQVVAGVRHNVARKVAAITAPTLVITGDVDRVIDSRSSFRLARKIPNAKLVVVSGAGHNFTTDKPEESLKHVVSFLKGKL